MMETGAFQSNEIARFWSLLGARLDAFVQLAANIDYDGLHWQPPAEATNSIAVLVVHTLGNVEESLLEVLLRQPVGRNRDAEFVEREVTANELLTSWTALRSRLETALMSAPGEELEGMREHPRLGSMSGRDVLIITVMHASEHYGQAELTRDLYGARFSVTGS